MRLPFRKNGSGNVGVRFGVVAVPLMMGVTIAIDFSSASKDRAGLQAALDSAVIASVSVPARDKRLGADPVKIAQKTFRANFTEPTTSLSFSLRDGIMYGEATAVRKSMLAKFQGMESLTIAAKSAATANPQRHPACFMAMHPTRKHTLELKGSVSVYGPDCHIYGNSDHPDDVVDPHTPDNYLTGKTVQAVGYGHHYIQNVKPPLEYAPEILSDPLRMLAFPTPGACLATGKTVTGNGKIKLKPGTYCNGLTISNANNVELEAGTYIVTNGTFKLSNAHVSGKDVTIAIVGTTNPVDWDSSTLELEAPEHGPLAGMAVIAERKAGYGAMRSTFVDVYGTIYMPNTELLFINSHTKKPKAKWTVWITDGISWEGSGTKYINFDIKNSRIPYPQAMLNVIPTVGPGRVRLIN